MVPLPDTYKDHGQVFKLVKRQGPVCMFTNVTKTEYEVFVVRRHKACKFPNGRSYPAREAVPATSEWGDQSYYCVNLERAEMRFRQLVAYVGENDSDPPSAVPTLPDDQNGYTRGTVTQDEAFLRGLKEPK